MERHHFWFHDWWLSCCPKRTPFCIQLCCCLWYSFGSIRGCRCTSVESIRPKHTATATTTTRACGSASFIITFVDLGTTLVTLCFLFMIHFCSSALPSSLLTTCLFPHIDQY